MPDQSRKKRIAVLISGAGTNLQALIDRQPEGHYEIALVLSNCPDAGGLEKAKKAGIHSVTLDHKLFADRESFDAEMMKLIDSFQIDAVILAGFMRILTPAFTEHYLGRMLNIHPSLLPKYQGLNTHKRALEANEKEHGLSIHFVTAELDGGPVILQAKTTIEEFDSEENLRQKVQLLEHKAYPLVVNWLSEGLLEFKNNQVWFQHEQISKPIQL